MKTITTLFCLCIIGSLWGQSIEKFSIDSGGASASAGGIQILYTIGEVNIAERSAGNIQISEGFINPQLKIKVNPKLFLQGPLISPANAGLMNDNLRSQNYIPTISPYSDAATCDAAIFNVSGDNAIVDWVWIELRAANDNTKIVAAKSALVQRDGDVVAVDGVSDLAFPVASNSYYVVVNHRNHLGAMTNNTVVLSNSVTAVVDFTTNALDTYGSNARAVLNSGDLALWAGDVNANANVRFSGSNNDANAIKDDILSAPGNGFNSVTYTLNGYANGDIDMNGAAKFSGANNDSNYIKDNVLSHPSNGFNSSTFTINTTVPTGN